MSYSSSLMFKVRRCEPELITPAKPTPHELKSLSDIDDQLGLRYQVPGILFYRNNGSMEGKDPVEIIRNAIANVLVFYYPLAGRLRERHGRKLIVDCTGEGVMFIEAEADADVRLDQFGDTLQPPFPCWEELLYDVPGSAGVLDCPLMLIQVRRCEPELITPAKPTPHELKSLSDIDDQLGLRYQVPGRLREGHGRKLIVDCTGEGVMFIEADADVRLDQFGDTLQPPFPCWEELLYDVPGSAGVLDCPLMLIQVTRLLCGGFIFALRHNHTVTDGSGMVQFLTAVGEMARGATIPTVKPTWQRELLTARETPTVTCEHREYDVLPEIKDTNIPLEDMAYQPFFFGPREITALRKHMPPHLRSSTTTFEMLIACLWRCRTIAIQPGPQEIVRVICVVNARRKLSPPLPEGYYGNVLAMPVALTTAEKLCQNPVGYAVELVKKAKNSVTDEYMRSLVDMLVLRERPFFTLVNTWLVSDVTRGGIEAMDFGWGEPVYGGPPHGVGVDIPGVASLYIPTRNSAGEDGILVPVCLPGSAMEKFIVEFESLIIEPVEDLHTATTVLIGSSSL